MASGRSEAAPNGGLVAEFVITWGFAKPVEQGGGVEFALMKVHDWGRRGWSPGFSRLKQGLQLLLPNHAR
jgi:hypothetical protein